MCVLTSVLHDSLMIGFFRSPAGRASRIRCAAVLGATLVLSAAGCDRAVSSGTRDGVRIVRSHRPQWPESGGWTVQPTPAYALDGPAAGTRFLRPTGVVLLDGGGVAVADAGDLTVHFFDGTGTLIRSVRPGDAPVMPRSFTQIYRAGEEVRVAQRGLEPTLVFDMDGNYLREIAPPPVSGFPFIAQYRPMDDGTFLAVQPPSGLIARSEEWTENMDIVRIAGDGSAERVASLPAIRLKKLPGAVEPIVYGPVLAFAFTADGIWAGFPARFTISLYDAAGTMRRQIGRDWEPVAVTADQKQAVHDRMMALLDESGIPDDPGLREDPEQKIRELGIADTLPAFGRMLLDHEGRLWIERVPPLPVLLTGPVPVRPEPTPWDVFDTDGVWLGTIETPADTQVMDIDSETIAGVLRADDVSRVVVHRIDHDPGQD